MDYSIIIETNQAIAKRNYEGDFGLDAESGITNNSWKVKLPQSIKLEVGDRISYYNSMIKTNGISDEGTELLGISNVNNNLTDNTARLELGYYIYNNWFNNCMLPLGSATLSSDYVNKLGTIDFEYRNFDYQDTFHTYNVLDDTDTNIPRVWWSDYGAPSLQTFDEWLNNGSSSLYKDANQLTQTGVSNGNTTATNNLAFYTPDTQRLYIGKNDWTGPYNNGYDTYHNANLTGNYTKKYDIITSNSDVSSNIGFNSPIIIGNKITESLNNPNLEGNDQFVNPQVFDYTDDLVPDTSLPTLKHYFKSDNVLQVEDECCKAVPTTYGKMIYDIQNGDAEFSISEKMYARTNKPYPHYGERNKYFWNSVASGDYKRTMASSELYGDLNLSKNISVLNPNNLENSSFYTGSENPEKNYPTINIETDTAYPTSNPRDLGEQFVIFDDLQGDSQEFTTDEISKITNNIIFRTDDISDYVNIKKPTTSDRFLSLDENNVIMTNMIANEANFDKIRKVFDLLEKPSTDIKIDYNNQDFKDSLYATLELGQLDDRYSQSIYQLDAQQNWVVNSGIPMPVSLPCVKSIADKLEKDDPEALSYNEYKKRLRLPVYAGLFCNEDNIFEDSEIVPPYRKCTLLKEFRSNHMYEIDFYSRYNSTRTPQSNNLHLPSTSKFKFTDIDGKYYDDTKIKENDLGICVAYRNLVEQGDNVIEFGLGSEPSANQFSVYSVDTTNNYSVNTGDFINKSSDSDYADFGDNSVQSLTDNNTIYLTQNTNNVYSESANKVNISDTKAIAIEYEASQPFVPTEIDLYQQATEPSEGEVLVALAGAGSREIYRPRAMSSTFVDFPTSYYENSSSTINQIYDNSIDSDSFSLKKASYNYTTNPVIISYEFEEPKNVTIYRLWARASSGDKRDEMPSAWQLRASASKSDYENGTYDTLDTKTGVSATDWELQSYNANYNGKFASSYSSTANTYTFTNNNNYKYYVLYITAGGDGTYMSMGEFALYGSQSYDKYSVPFAGAGDYNIKGQTKPYSSYGLFNGSGTNRADIVIPTNSFGSGKYYSSSTMSDKLHDNLLNGTALSIRNGGIYPLAVAYEFTTAQIITKYMVWAGKALATKLPKDFELRGADKATYISNDSSTYTILDSRTGITNYEETTTDEFASNKFNKAKVFSFTNTTAFKYYILHITDNNGSTYSVDIGEWALFGDVDEIPLIGGTQSPVATNSVYTPSDANAGGEYTNPNALWDNLVDQGPDSRDCTYFVSNTWSGNDEWNMKFEFVNQQVVTFMNIWNMWNTPYFWAVKKFRLFGKNGAFTSTTDGTLIQTEFGGDYSIVTNKTDWPNVTATDTNKYANVNVDGSITFGFNNTIGYTHYQITIDSGSDSWFSGSSRFGLRQMSFGGYTYLPPSESRMPKKIIIQGQKLNDTNWLTLDTSELITEPGPAGGETKPQDPALSTLVPPYQEKFNLSNTLYKKVRLVVPEAYTQNSINIGEWVMRKRNHLTNYLGDNKNIDLAELYFDIVFNTKLADGSYSYDTTNYLNIDPSNNNKNHSQDGDTSTFYRISLNSNTIYSTTANKVEIGSASHQRFIKIEFDLPTDDGSIINNFLVWSTSVNTALNSLMKHVELIGTFTGKKGLEYESLFDGVLSDSVPAQTTYPSINSENPYSPSTTLNLNKSNKKYKSIIIIVKSVYETNGNYLSVSDLLFSGYDSTNHFKEVPFIGFTCRPQISSVNKYKIPLPIEGEFFGIPRSLQNNSLSFINSWERKIKPSDDGIVVAKVELLNSPLYNNGHENKFIIEFSGGSPLVEATGEVEYILHKDGGGTHLQESFTHIKITNNGRFYKAPPVINFYSEDEQGVKTFIPINDSHWVTPPQIKITMGTFGESFNDGIKPNVQSQYPYILAGANDISASFDEAQSRMGLSSFHTLMRQGQEANNLQRYYDASMVYNSDIALINPDGESGNEVMKINNRKFYCNSTRAGFTEAKPVEDIEKQVLPIKNPYIRQKGIASGLSGVGLINLYAGKVDGSFQKIDPTDVRTYGDTLFDKLGFDMKQLLPQFGKQNTIFSRGLHNKNVSKNDKPLSTYNEMVKPFTTNGVISATLNQSFNVNNLSYLVGNIDGNNATEKAVPQTSEILIAEALPDKYSYSHILIYSNIIPKHNYIAAQTINKINCIGNITRSYQTGNIIFGNNPGMEYIVDKSYILSEIDVELRTELGLNAPVDAGSTIVFKINKRKPIPLFQQEKQ